MTYVYTNSNNNPKVGDKVRVLLDDGTAPFGEVVFASNNSTDLLVKVQSLVRGSIQNTMFSFTENEVLLAFDDTTRDMNDKEGTILDRPDVKPIIN